MKKLFYFIVLAVIMTVGNGGVADAQSFYKKQFINQNFNEIETWPSGWSVRTTTSSGNYSNLGRNGGIAISGGMVAFSGSGSGSRGAELVLPSTSTASFGYPADSIWNIEFDWTLVTTAASLSERNAFAIVFSGSNGVATNNADGWYVPGIFGLYVYKNGGFIHYMNLDRDGLPKTASDGTLIPGETNGHAFLAGNSQSWRRATATDPATQSPVGTADSLNAPSATAVTAALGGVYHIQASIDFKVGSQKVLSLTITDVSNPENTATISEPQEFLAPTYAGSAATVAPEDRIVTDLSVLSMINTRGCNGSNGNSAQLSGSGIDNLEIYILKESLGQANATVNYKDQDGGVAKTARIVENLEIGEIFNLVSADKERFTDNGNYYAYNEEATLAANASKGDGESVEVVAGGVNLDVIFKKTAATAGTYVWTGANGPNWDELQANFSVSGGADISYQAGNAVAFSATSAANKEVSVTGILDLGDQNVTISAADYSFSGTGRISGTGVVNIDAATTLGFDNRLDGGAVINTTAPLILKHRAAAKTYNPTVANATLKLQTLAGREEPISIPVTGVDAAINIAADSIAPHTLKITNAPVINLQLNQSGRLSGTRWTTTALYSGSQIGKGTQINVTTGVTGETLPTGFGTSGSTGTNVGVLDSVKVNLGDNVRIVRDYNENNNVPFNASHSYINIGELTGSASSYLEGGWVPGRAMTYRVGALGTDAVFNGSIRPYQIFTAATDTTPEVIADCASAIGIIKTGAGSWTVNGAIDFPNTTVKTMYNHITAEQGKLVLASVNFPDNDSVPHAINVRAEATLELKTDIVAPGFNAIVLTVDSGATLIANGVSLGAYSTNIKGTIAGGAKVVANFSSFENATVKLNVNSFTEGGYEQIDAPGDIIVIGSTLDITVKSATKDARVQLLKFGGNPDLGFAQILVNGDDITENTAETPDAKFYFDFETGELVALEDYSSTGIEKIDLNKPVKSVQYFDLLGRAVSKDSKGFVIKNITYTDNTKAVQKVYVRER